MVPCFFVQTESLCFFIGVVRPFTFNVTINMIGFKQGYLVSVCPLVIMVYCVILVVALAFIVHISNLQSAFK